MAKNDRDWLILLLVVAIVYGGTQGWFQFIIAPQSITDTTIIERLQQNPTGTCSIAWSENPVCVGDPETGTARGRANDVCNLYYSTNGGATWAADPTLGTFHLNAAGTFSSTRVAEVPAAYLFKMLCADGCIATAPLTVQFCAEPPPDDGGVPPGGDGGADFGGYATCEAWATAEGKEFWTTNAGIFDLDACYDYAQSYCSQFGGVPPVLGGVPPWYVTMFDWSPPDCCIWNCNGSWN